MRPGPGLVVMALAFISGARRGSTSSISSKTTITTSSPPPLPPQTTITKTTSPFLTITTTTQSPSIVNPTTTNSHSISSSLPTTSSSYFPTSPTSSTSTATGNTITTTLSPPQPTYEDLNFYALPSLIEPDYGDDDNNQNINDQTLYFNKRSKEPVSFNFFNRYFTQNFPTSTSVINPYPSTPNYFAYTYPLPSHLAKHYDDPRSRTESNKVVQTEKNTSRANVKFRRRRKRRTRSANLNYRGSGSGATDEEVIENLNDSVGDSLNALTLTTAVDSSSSDSGLSDQTTTLARGLPVHFPSLTAADSSRSLDEDDIFALVAEDDLLSEESFDHLIKLTNDKIGDTNEEEDYSSGTESVVESSSGSSSSSSSGSGAPDNVHLLPEERQQKTAAVEHFVRQQQHYQHEQQYSQENNKNFKTPYNTNDDNDNVDHVIERINNDVGNNDNVNDNINDKGAKDHNSETKDNFKTVVYNAHLVSNSNEKLVSISETDSQETLEKRIERKTETATTKHPKDELDVTRSPNRYRTILESSFALTRLNPWISACDLAQPGPLSAPDLQGECSAGTLPVAWVDEGPGPPICLESCKEDMPFTNKLNKDSKFNNLNKNNMNNSKENIKNKNDNKLINKLVGYTTTTNTFNIKLRNSQPTISQSMSININDNDNDNNKNTVENNLKQKLLNLFNYYQNNYNSNSNSNSNNNNKNNNNSNNSKMAKTRRNLRENQLPAIASASTKTTATTAMPTTSNASNVLLLKNNSHILDPFKGHSNEDYELLHELLMQHDEAAINHYDFLHNDHHQFNNDAAIATAAKSNSNNNNNEKTNNKINKNNLVKITVRTAAAAAANHNKNDNNNKNNNNNNKNPHNQYELKFNHMETDHNNNNKNNNNNNKHRNDATPVKQDTLVSLTNAVNNRNSDQYLNMPSLTDRKQEKQQQQQPECLDYLGDSDKTLPMHLCHSLTPSERLVQLRHLRLRNCCERNVYSALHTLALNVTLSGGTGCVRILNDLMNLDALASRITCGVTEILFRFDCRQVYSIIHQCDDCKEAYRRWVCSTLVPYFAETSDVLRPPTIFSTTAHSTTSIVTSVEGESNGVGHFNLTNQTSTSGNSSIANNTNNNTKMASNTTTSHNAKTSHDINSKSNIDNNNDMQQFLMKQLQQQQQHQQTEQEHHHVNRRNIQDQQHQHRVTQKMINILNFGNGKNGKNDNNNNNNNNNISNNNNNKKHIKSNDIHYKTTINHNKIPPQQHQSPSLPTLVTRALTFNDIIIHTMPHHHNSHAILKNPIKSLSLHSNINVTNNSMTFNHNVHHKSTNKRRKRSENSKNYSAFIAASDVNNDVDADVDVNDNDKDMSTSGLHKMQQPQQQQQQQYQKSYNFISTANTEDFSYARNPVITKVFKRSKRKEFEFRKRRRIRPCLSVCQTVEQKCPYLLPADRAPSMPTQYAGEPTFLCLDYNIAETEEQLRKASHGPNDCCYTFCSHTADGICTYCDDMWEKTDIEREAETFSEERKNKVHNIPMKIKNTQESGAAIRVETKIQQKLGEEKNGLKMSTVAIAVLNDTAFENATRLAERLQYYAYCEGVFYYDDQPEDMPEYPTSENCPALPSVQSRCTIPYYATNYISSADMLGSYRKNSEAQKLLVWLSTLLCLWSCYSARSLKLRRYTEDKRQTHAQQIIQNSAALKTTAYKEGFKCQSCQTREIMQTKAKQEKIIKIWYDEQEKRIIIIVYSQEMASVANNKPLSLVTRNLKRHLGYSSRILKLNLKKFKKLTLLILLLNCKEILLLLFKKRQKHRKQNIKYLNLTFINKKYREKYRNEYRRDLKIYKRERTRMKSKNVKFSFKQQQEQQQIIIIIIINIHYHYNYNSYTNNYYYRSCRQIFSCSCNITNNTNNNNSLIIIMMMMIMIMIMITLTIMILMMIMIMIYINKLKYNFSTCNFTKNKNNIIMMMKINFKKISIIKLNAIIKTSTTATHILYESNIIIQNYYKININIIILMIIIVIKIILMIMMMMMKMIRVKDKKQKKCFSFIPHISTTKINSYKNYNKINIYYDTLNNSYLNIKFKTQQQQEQQHNHLMINNKIILKKSLSFILLKNFIIMALIFIKKLLFKLYHTHHHYHLLNNNIRHNYHHLYNNNYNNRLIIIQIKFNSSFSPYNSCYSKKLNYRYFYYYNFNINDWWQRRWWLQHPSLSLFIFLLLMPPTIPILPTLTFLRLNVRVYHTKHFLLLSHLMFANILGNFKRIFHQTYSL